MRTFLLVGILGVLSSVGCQSAPEAERDATPSSGPELPPTVGRFDYQLGRAHGSVPGLDVVVRDATSDPEAGAYNICYVNGFQTQPGEEDLWIGGRENLLLHNDRGEPVVDPEWPDEYVLDPSTSARRDGILEVLGPVIVGCADDGYDAVEIDNLDTWTRFDDPASGAIHREGALELARSYVRLAHGNGLAIGQKNAAELAETGRDELGFDFAVTEECAAYDECSAYTEVYGEHVLQIEYVDNLPEPFDMVCASADRAPLTILRDRDLGLPGTDGYTYDQCPPPT
ncbi:endo alpha-1,4 polygalactosaminidase [Stackebrandtia soli]|uniref:endo alpha-1,4 polygalactosaminidase n=1 Tax=Stackebrandtia soli TaxID=1892856 RepID=UPI0039EB4657